jgi:cytochrome c
MRYLPFNRMAAGMAVAIVVALCGMQAMAQQAPPWANVGTKMTPEEIASMAKDTGPSGKDLPPGRGTAKEGERIFMVKCSMCHGMDMKGVKPAPSSGSLFRGDPLVGGKGVPLWGPDGPNPVSRAYHVAYATSLWNAIAISMPYTKPGSLTPDEVYSLVALILAKNEIIKEDMVLDRETLPKVKMPQRDNYLPPKFEDVLDIQKRGCFKTYAVCEPMGR